MDSFLEGAWQFSNCCSTESSVQLVGLPQHLQ
jgi:hypothetical protein